MSKIELPAVTGSNNTSRINDNFQKIEDALNKEVLYRKGYVGEPNEMGTNLDMNGKEILNVATGTSDGSLVTKSYVDQGLSMKFDKSGGPLSGSVDMQNNQINNLPNATQPSQPATYAQLLQVEAPGDSLLRSELAAAGGAGLVGGVDTPAADESFAGGMLPSRPDNTAQTSAVFGSAKEVRLGGGTYLISSTAIANDKEKIDVRGVGRDSKIQSSGTAGVLSAARAGAVRIRDLSIDCGGQNLPATKHGMAFIDQPNLTVEDVEITGVAGVGTGLIAYSANATPTKNIKIRSVSVAGDRASSTNTNGILLESAELGCMTDAQAEGIIEFALELKSFARHNTLSDLRAVNSNGGLYYGSSTPGSYPEYNAASNVISKDCDFGYVSGFGVHNLLGNYLCDARNSQASTPEGARVAGNDNAIFGMKFVAGVNGHAVRYNDGALNNFTQMTYSKGSGPTQRAVVMAAGAKRNVTEIAHPGDGVNSIITYIGDVSGSGLAGGDANVTYCHATGEYYGSLSTGWLWRNGVSGGSRAASHKWRMESVGTSLMSISTDGDGLAGLNINNPSGNRNFNWLESGGYWDLSGGNFSVRFFSSSIRPGADNTMDFGTATNRGRTAYFVTGTINTSDAREKTAPCDITEAVLDAADDISINVWQWLDAIAKKGEDQARWHFGPIAQQVRDAFAKHGLDGCDYGLLCYDKWDDQFEDVLDDDGAPTGEQRMVTAAGDRWGIRPDQCLWLIAAALRRRSGRLEERINLLEDRLLALEK